MKISEVLSKYFNERNIKSFELSDVNRLMCYYLKLELKEYIINKKSINLESESIVQIYNLLDMYYINKIPMQYILGKQVFFNESYIVNDTVLIPRQDSEILVNEAIKYINENNFKNCLDLCTGTGCIGISIAKNSDIKKVDLVDISKDVLIVTNMNIKLNNVESKCKCINSNLFLDLNENVKYDIIVSNPPYIKKKDIEMLDDYVKKEPILALDGGESGLDFYKKIFKDACGFLNDNSYILCEIGFDQKEDLEKIIKEYDFYEYIDTIKDYGGNNRVIVCRFHQK